ncbi:phytoene/squalene synthase family protein [Nocardioides rubriscoriae]|uniref:phytoene/squalene synthase family protein n=1 Tax=Nocardioides rubriscoriae TaxID=642762 RepID=UPI0011DF4587|nr:squalene/phytoene synthase family protein [Nocardioides rubriscoriae]
MSARRARPGAHAQYDAVADASAAVVIGAYSSSFGAASRLLSEPVRTHVRNLYALVRVADEIVDAPRPGATPASRAAVLDTLEQETLDALAVGHSSNLVVHAFARTARACGVDEALVRPFFDSMRADLETRVHDDESFARYVYGSAEVVGLMCLRAFVADLPDRDRRYERCAPGARRLGAAFQKVNFLRDLGDDADVLGRRYFPGIDPDRLTDADRDRLLDDVDADLAAAAAVVPLLPRGSRVAVCAAHDLFAELSVRLRATPAAELRRRRVRVPGVVKARIVSGAVARRGRPHQPQPQPPHQEVTR